MRDIERRTRLLEGDRDESRRRLRAVAEDDVVFDNGRKLKLRSPNGTYFSLQVSDAGVLSTTNEGTSL